MLLKAVNFLFELSLVNLLLIKFVILDSLLLSVRMRRRKEEAAAVRKQQEADQRAEQERIKRDQAWAADRSVMHAKEADVVVG